jgi:hypothetical protein
MLGDFYFGFEDRIAILDIPPGGSIEFEDDASCTPNIFFKEFTEGDVFKTLDAARQSTINALINAKGAIVKNPKV